MRLKGLMTEKY